MEKVEKIRGGAAAARPAVRETAPIIQWGNLCE